jgi:hypothetical protein
VTYHWVSNTGGAGTVYPSEAPDVSSSGQPLLDLRILINRFEIFKFFLAFS